MSDNQCKVDTNVVVVAPIIITTQVEDLVDKIMGDGEIKSLFERFTKKFQDSKNKSK